MTRWVRWVLVVVVVLASAGAGVAAWALTRGSAETMPEISVYSHGHSVRVGPYVYCNVVNLNECQKSQTQGELAVDARYPIQLSVPASIGRAPWRLLQVYEDESNSTSTTFRPNTRLAVTIPTTDPHRGKLTGIVVQLLTLVQDPKGELHDAPHAEWSVRAVWS
ncbi:DUF2771 domain-containing protein [Candidatus Mycolicibacterium alkanivorans]|uniref:DUF2771 domain-containing protein n=1 Tax=Candidatus Mycolicibacterium alkanivorans TaxID=2954114 RepID=A0ABS9YTT4_9MYCO|nr:DUF2771 domain-containing protein [Candidatus Mycolicibacterium alkanivorans]MCI4674622.1 DUF2771 domain-containing protein [Candidatus Mycolicibacterium alkanivorans]